MSSPRTPYCHVRAALAALAFLSRLGPGKLLDAQTLHHAVFWYAPVGLVLGLLALVPHALGWFSPFIQAWLYVGLLAFVTRGLHWDGLMDLADALGSNAQGEQFWRIMKDSRVGAFAVLGLLFVASGQIICVGELLGRNIWQPLLAAPLIARAACVALLARAPAWPGSTLALAVKPGATGGALLFSLVLALAAAFWSLGVTRTAILVVALLVALFALLRVARKHGGLNGDFLGAMIHLGELLVLLAAVL